LQNVEKPLNRTFYLSDQPPIQKLGYDTLAERRRKGGEEEAPKNIIIDWLGEENDQRNSQPNHNQIDKKASIRVLVGFKDLLEFGGEGVGHAEEGYDSVNSKEENRDKLVAGHSHPFSMGRVLMGGFEDHFAA